jgi:hypothetical protein
MAEDRHSHPRALLDLLIVGGAVCFLVGISRSGVEAGHPIAKGVGAVLGGLYVIYLGVLFLLSYFFPDTTYVLSFLRYVCEECSIPRSAAGRHMALFYFLLGLVIGVWVLLVGLGVL